MGGCGLESHSWGCEHDKECCAYYAMLYDSFYKTKLDIDIYIYIYNIVVLYLY